LRSVYWADVPQLFTRDRCCPVAWQQSWPNGNHPRPSALQAGHIPSWHGSCESYALSPGAGCCCHRCRQPQSGERAAGHDKTLRVVRLSVVPGSLRRVRSQAPSGPAMVLMRRPSPHRTDCCRAFRRREVSRADSRVRSPGTFTCTRCPAARSALDAGPGAYHTPAAVWWGAFAVSVVIRDQVVIVNRLAGLLGQQRWRQDHQLRRPVYAAGQPICPQVCRCVGSPRSERELLALTGRSGTQRARPLRPELAALPGVWPSSLLVQCAAGRDCWRVEGNFAVLPRCTVRRPDGDR
jgi:hypothetical protein